MTDATKGIAAMVSASVIWGLVPLYYKLLTHVPAIEILAHRTIWSLVIFAVVLMVQRRVGHIFQALKTWRSFATLAAAALLISINWFVFIWSVSAGLVTEASLGYFLFPLVAVVLGRLVLGERLVRGQWIGVCLAASAVVLLTIGLGVAPWIALAISATFGLYGLIKKGLDVGPVVSVTCEVLVLSPIALWVLFITPGATSNFGFDFQDSVLLIFSGVLTALPLMLFSYASRRVRLSTVGLVQYLNPTLQFMCATVIFAEPLSMWHAIAFPLIWVALAIYSWSGFRQEKARAI